MAAKGYGQHQSDAVVGRRYWRPRMRRGRPHQSEKDPVIEAEGSPTDETRKVTFTVPFGDVSDCAMPTIKVDSYDSSNTPRLNKTLELSKARTGSIRPVSLDWSALSEHPYVAPALAHSNASSTTVYDSEAYCRVAPDDHYGWEADWDHKLAISSSVRRVCLLKRKLFQRVFGLGGSVVPILSRSASLSNPEEDGTSN